MSNDLRLRALIHGDPKTGKSSLAETCVGPRLIIDAEGGTMFGAKPRLLWEDPGQAPPVPKDPDTSVVVIPQKWRDVELAHQWLSSGQHPFNSYVMDSITEVQRKAKATISANGFDQAQWGELLDKMMTEMTLIRNLTVHPTNPLWTVVIVAHSEYDEKTNLIRPMVQGGLRKHLGGLYDTIGHLRISVGDGHRPGRELVIDARPGIEAGDRTKILRRKYDGLVSLHLDEDTDKITPDLTDMLKTLNGAP